MGAIVFAFGSRPGISEHDAIDLAELLMRTRTLGGVSASGKIAKQAEKDPGREVSEDVELNAEELQVLARVLADEPWPQEQTWFAHFRDEVTRARAGR